jgi:hypothetical protein
MSEAGDVTDVQIRRADSEADREALLNAVAQAAPFPAPPEELRHCFVGIPIQLKYMLF